MAARSGATKRALPCFVLAIFVTVGLPFPTFLGSSPARRVLRRAAIQPVPESKKACDLLAGKYYNAKVVSMTKNGATLELGVDRPGFLHVAQVQEEFLENINDVLKLDDEIQVRIRRHRGNEVEVGIRDREEYHKRPPDEFAVGEEVEGTLLAVVNHHRRIPLVDVGGQKLKVRVVRTTGCTMDVEEV
eukprot:Skav222503  [mRNA]  locus=scaffold1835:762200:767451:- [translate_table: standard]